MNSEEVRSRFLHTYIKPSDLDGLPRNCPYRSGHPWYMWFKHHVDMNQEEACDAIQVAPSTLHAKMIGVRGISTQELYELVSAWVDSGRVISAEDIGNFVLLHGHIRHLRRRGDDS